MNKLPNRTKLVTFRLSEPEFDAVQRVCSVVRAGSVSEFARSAIFRYMESLASPKALPEPPINAQLELVTVQLQSLSAALGQLRACMATALERTASARDAPCETYPRSIDGLSR